ncbi:riboflavin biosynthesis protein RibD [Solemya pervernicosa gill symbiont]|uniref:Riboflavin biosynthesis protein RibD n=3 Tax=Gammaproteobacteria incertae sedis TaxID=118884 RepID=A0A1T2L1L6_9GAMM|nr:riboflavin biosynthesis protein RibD [Solemya pervernicosa gill symbiont]QKQ28299.1 bifunctional diaminohydroxyphosphoribosylaminopyrimidine deaminase/5-amino-6-(5-phosphoribosylamino)uracil reductase RibD [Candidatus Reidiella endopervernicosa]
MARAIELAARGRYTTPPNPCVGCVIVQSGEVVGEGWHQRAGEDHAEINALKSAGSAAGGATAYVTLEPCSHHGRTPPCSQALIKAGVARVVVAMEDPNPQVAGSGLNELREAGITVESGVLSGEAEALNPGFVKRMREGRPLVRSKLAMSLDGRTAMASGESVWITGSDARRDVHRMRAASCAIVTGVGTVLADDPSLNVRLEEDEYEGELRQPLRVVLDPRLSTPVDAKMLKLPGRTLIVTACDDEEQVELLNAAGADVLVLPAREDAIDLPELMRQLAALEINEVMLETGATLSGAMLQAGLIDEMVVYVAPHLMGNSARGLFHLPGLEQMDQRIDLKIDDIRAVGDDWRITARPTVN